MNTRPTRLLTLGVTRIGTILPDFVRVLAAARMITATLQPSQPDTTLGPLTRTASEYITRLRSASYGFNALNHTWAIGSGSWFVDSNWTPATIPSSGDNAFINNGGTAQVSAGEASANTVTLGQNSSDTGSLYLGLGGVLTAAQIVQGAGVGKVNFDGGTLQANTSGVDLLASFQKGNLTAGTNNAYIDTNGFAVTIGSTFGGAGALVKKGAGSLNLSGDYSSLSNGIIVTKGTLSITQRLDLYPRTLLISPQNGESALLEVTGSGWINAVRVTMAAGPGSTATANIGPGGVIGANGVHVAGQGTNVMNVMGGSVNPEYFAIGGVSGSTGTVNVYSGTVSGSYVYLAVGANGGTGYLNLYGGSASRVVIGGNNSVVNVYGGSVLEAIGIGASCTFNLFDGVKPSTAVKKASTEQQTFRVESGYSQGCQHELEWWRSSESDGRRDGAKWTT